MKRAISLLRFVLAAAFVMAAACSDSGEFNNVPGDCPNAPTNPECVQFCEDNPTDPYCTGNVGNDGGNNTTDGGNNTPDGSVACGGACGADEVCDEASDTCVACLVDGDCADGVCLSGATTAGNTCVACKATADCESGVCDTESNTCVGCLADADCTEAGAAKCDVGTNTCVGCDDSAQCAGIAGAEVCDVAAETCVQCVADSDCVVGADTFACSVLDNTCSDIIVGMANSCEGCVSNSSCGAGHACLQLDYMGNPNGTFCIPLQAENEACPKGYAVSSTRADVEGQSNDFCVIAETRTTCEAFNAIGTQCAGGMATECAEDGAICGTVAGIQNLCTFGCLVSSQCPDGYTCDNMVCDGM